MQVAAFILSIVAIGLSGAALLYTRKHWLAADETLRIERDRRADEITTASSDRQRLRFRLLDDDRKGVYFLVNDGPGTVYDVRAKLRERRAPVSLGEFPKDRKYRCKVRGRTVPITWHHKPDLSDEAASAVLVVQ